MNAISITGSQLESLLRKADEVLALSQECSIAFSAVCDRAQYPPTVLLSGPYLCDGEGEWVYFLTPESVTWPPKLYYYAEAYRNDELLPPLEQVSKLSSNLSQLRERAMGASPGYLGRMFGGVRLDLARMAAAELQERLNTIDESGVLKRARTSLAILERADRTQEEGVRIFAEEAEEEAPLHGYIKIARNMLNRGLHNRFNTRGPVSYVKLESTPLIAQMRQVCRVRGIENSGFELRRRVRELTEGEADLPSRNEAPTQNDRDLITALSLLDALIGEEDSEQDRRRRLLDLGLSAEASEWDRTVTAPEAAVVISGNAEENHLWKQLQEDMAWATQLSAAEGQNLIPAVEDPWEDYQARPAHYQELLVQLQSIQS